jgi:sporulation protein YlmC with PRC-barrel domain
MWSSRILTFSVLMGIMVACGVLKGLADDQATNPSQPTPSVQPTQPITQPAQNPAIPSTTQKNPAMPSKTRPEGERALVIKSMPSKKIVGSSVQNPKGEKIGSIEDMVIDLESGRVAYVALSYGGVLGIGDKLFAVPFDAFKTGHDTNNNILFVLDLTKDKLENAPGFDKNHWPDFANPDWRNQIDTYYHRTANRTSAEQLPVEHR